MPRRVSGAAVAATGSWVDPDGVRMPAGEVHAWERGTGARRDEKPWRRVDPRP